MEVKDLLKLLHQKGWVIKAQKGSHLQLIHSERKNNRSSSWRRYPDWDIKLNFEASRTQIINSQIRKYKK